MKIRRAISRLRLALRIIGILAVILFLTSHQAKAMKLLAPAWFGMEPIAPGVYADKAMPAAERRKVLQMIPTAKSQVARYYGNVTASPKLFFCSSEAAFQSIGGTKQTGLSYFSCASVFSPRGLSAPIIAHEWSHAELNARAGGWWNRRRVPRWFDEGLAVTVSEEPRHSEAVYEAARNAGAALPALSELETSRQWSAAVKKYRDPKLNPGNRAIVYAAAGHEVRAWFSQAGAPGLLKFIGEIRSGGSFAGAYADAKLK